MKRLIALSVLVTAGIAGTQGQMLQPCQSTRTDQTNRPKPKLNSSIRPARIQIPQGVIERDRLCGTLIPLYPAEAKEKHLEGSVVLKAIIGTDGAIKDLTAISGDPIFIEPAVRAVKDWRYRPHKLKGKAVEVETTITVNFRIEQPSSPSNNKNSQPASPTGN